MHAAIKRRLALQWGDVLEARRDAEEALVVFEKAGDERGLSRAWQLLASILFFQGQLASAEQHLELALVHARNAGDLAEQTEIYSTLAALLSRGPKPVGATIRRCEEVLEETEGNRTIAGLMYHPMAHAKARLGEFEEALDLATRCRDIYLENGAMWPYWLFAEIEWDIKMLAGEPEAAVEILTESYEQVERMGGFPLESAWLAQSLYAVGRFEEAERRAQAAVDAVDDALGRSAGLGALARVRAQQGRFDEAESMAREAASYLARTDYSTDRTWVTLDLAEVLRLAGRPKEAIDAMNEALGLFEQREDAVSAARVRQLIEALR
jgi:tetratricopeptide (TPR) repeat protein